MSAERKFHLLPHEFAFGCFFALTWAGLALTTGTWTRDALIFLVMLAAVLGAVVWCERNATAGRWRVRLALYPVLMNAAYFALKTVAPALHPQLADGTLQAIDRALLGGNASVWMQRWVHPGLTEFLSLCYLGFFPYLVFTWVYYLAKPDLGLAKKLWSGFFTLYAVGFLGYILVPAAGPHLEPGLAAQFTVLLHGTITDLNARVVQEGSNRVDCFPSLHTAVSAYLLLFDFRHCRWRFWVWLVPCVGLWVSTIYLRFHYFTDVLAGLALAIAAFWFVNRQFRKEIP